MANLRAVANDDGTVDIYAEQGKSQTLTIKLYTDVARTTPFNLTGYSARGHIRAKYTGDKLAQFTCTISSPATGTIDVALGPSDTVSLSVGNSEKQYVYDIEYYTANDATVNLAMRGNYYLYPEATK